jgi:hypothetical protein
MAMIEKLPAGQRAVIILRDIEGCEAEEACTLLGITAENQRVLLHRARGRIRQTIDTLTATPQTTAVRGMPRRRQGGGTMVTRLIVWTWRGYRGASPVPA